MTRRRLLFSACAALASAATGARAQGPAAWPTRSISAVVPYGPGGAVDVMMRIVGEHMAQTLGQSIVVQNRPGGNANIGPGIVAQSPADGYTLLASSGALIVNPLLESNIPWSVRQFVPIARFVQSANVLVVPGVSKITTLKAFVEHARANPELTTNLSGQGNTQAVSREFFAKAAGIKLLDVAYKGGTSYIPDLIAGRLAVSVAPLNVVAQMVRDGQLNALAVTSERRAPALPDVPTFAESGYPEATAVSWYGLHGLAGTPKPALERLAEAVRLATSDPKVQSRVSSAGAEVAFLDTAAFEAFLTRETENAERFVTLIRSKRG
jgi:tripartite-type tricarboxylate transporter receptor subunit TctC